MGFFSDLKEDLSQAVNELMPEETPSQEEGFGDINEMLDRVDSIVIPDVEQEPADEPAKADEGVEETPAEETFGGVSEEPAEETFGAFQEAPVEETFGGFQEESAEGTFGGLSEEPVAETAKEPEAGQSLETELAAALEEPLDEKGSEPDMDLEKMLESALAANDVSTAPTFEEETVTEKQKWQR